MSAERTSRRTVGLLVNPIAGMGGTVGLKGTDGDTCRRARELGAEPVSPARFREFLSHAERLDGVRRLVAPGPMGAGLLGADGRDAETVGTLAPGDTGPDDTRRIAGEMLQQGADLLVFAGGDGTARDIADAIGLRVPVIAVPAGVKVYSPVFATNPRTAAELLHAWLDGADVSEQEVLDIDEDAYRAGRVAARHHGFLLVPESRGLLQAGKEPSGGGEASRAAKREIANWIVESMDAGTLYLLGSGTTVLAIAEALGVQKTLLGIDAVVDGEPVGSDLGADDIRRLLDEYDQARIIVTPLGGNGFVFGRGNKQFTPDIIRRVGLDNVIVVADREKLVRTRGLHVDTGDAGLDAEFQGFLDVVVGQNHRKMMRVL